MADLRPTRGSELLAEWRGREGLSQPDAAARFGLHPQQVSCYERGKGKPGIDNAHAIERGTDGFVYMRSWAEPPLDGDLDTVEAAAG